jgi:hypothetical protein
VIRLTAGHQARVEDKPEVKKAGGVYYTPTCIVNHIVANTVDRLLEGESDQTLSSQFFLFHKRALPDLRQLSMAKVGHERTALQRQIDATDRQIDQLVYELCALTEEEIRIVEDRDSG